MSDASTSRSSPAAQPPKRERITIRTIRRLAADGQKFACLTCYDATTARWLARAGMPMLLVGDTLAETILGHDQTIYASMDVMVALTAAVRRGAPDLLLMADMPFMSYQVSDEDALRNAARFMTEAGADLVKFEVDLRNLALVERAAAAGIPVVAHVGARPQQTKMIGGYRAAGRTAEEARMLVETAKAMEGAGAVMILIEAVPAEVSAEIVRQVRVPVIGCGAGPACHGQVIVLHDLLGLTDWQPRFAQPVTDFGSQLMGAAKVWMDRVRRSELGEHPYQMLDAEDSNATALVDPPKMTPSRPTAGKP